MTAALPSIELSVEAALFVRDHGGRLFIWTQRQVCCKGRTSLRTQTSFEPRRTDPSSGSSRGTRSRSTWRRASLRPRSPSRLTNVPATAGDRVLAQLHAPMTPVARPAVIPPALSGEASGDLDQSVVTGSPGEDGPHIDDPVVGDHVVVVVHVHCRRRVARNHAQPRADRKVHIRARDEDAVLLVEPQGSRSTPTSEGPPPTPTDLLPASTIRRFGGRLMTVVATVNGCSKPPVTLSPWKLSMRT